MALPIAQKAGGRLTLVHVINEVSPEGIHRYAWHFKVPEYRRLLAQVVTGTPSDEIVRIADDTRADLIVLGVTSRGAIGRRLIGSTAARVMRRVSCPVLAVPETRLERVPTTPQVDATTAVAA